MEIKKKENKFKVSLEDSIKFQLIVNSAIKDLELNSSDLEILVLLGLAGPIELKIFCDGAAKKVYGEESRSQNVRNRVVSLERRGFIYKTKRGKKLIALHPNMDVECKPNILTTYSFLNYESNQK